MNLTNHTIIDTSIHVFRKVLDTGIFSVATWVFTGMIIRFFDVFIRFLI